MRIPLLASLGLALALTPAAGDAQQPPDTTRRQRPDTTRAGVVTQEAAGEVSLAANRGLTADQVRQLQDSLRAIGCDPGRADGALGPQTRQALACARRTRGVTSMNLNDILRSLGLDFTARDSMAVGMAAQTGVAQPGAGGYAYGDPTFVRDTGVMRLNLDTMPANALGPGGVFVSTGTIARTGGGVWLRETSQQRRDPSAQGAPDTAVYRLVPRPAADTLPRPVRDTLRRMPPPPLRTDTARTLRTDTVPLLRPDTVRMRTDTTQRLRPDTANRPVADSTIRRMRDELLLTLPPGARRDSTQPPDTTRRAPPDTTTPPDTTRRRPPPPRR